jgi:syntaxin-binding protein 5
MAVGTEQGVAIVDIVQHKCILALATPDLYGACDPFNRTPKSANQSSATVVDRPEFDDNVTDRTLDQVRTRDVVYLISNLKKK